MGARRGEYVNKTGWPTACGGSILPTQREIVGAVSSGSSGSPRVGFAYSCHSNSDVLVVNGIVDYFRRLGSEAYHPGTIAIELLFIGAVVYTILRFLEGTPGARLMKGAGLLIVAGFLGVDVVATKFDWARIAVLYRYFVGGVFLTALIVFQPELRRGLSRLGETRWLRRFVEDPDAVIEPVMTAVGHLAKNKIGALIAVEGQVGLGTVIDTGVPLDARLTSDLLNTIFWPGSTLHDMGVVVREDRIVAAGCQFPLTDNPDMDRSLGSRHRAAVGMSEETDAAVIVVSEETGRISIAQRGQLDSGLDIDQLRSRLGAMLSQGGNRRLEANHSRRATDHRTGS